MIQEDEHNEDNDDKDDGKCMYMSEMRESQLD